MEFLPVHQESEHVVSNGLLLWDKFHLRGTARNCCAEYIDHSSGLQFVLSRLRRQSSSVSKLEHYLRRNYYKSNWNPESFPHLSGGFFNRPLYSAFYSTKAGHLTSF
ncbi:hypothetical protein SUGI_0368840 [Cryptomeria japonica]|nr:hypothetical protein SUGI_0368840 [Cryptomeria japonica]